MKEARSTVPSYGGVRAGVVLTRWLLNYEMRP